MESRAYPKPEGGGNAGRRSSGTRWDWPSPACILLCAWMFRAAAGWPCSTRAGLPHKTLICRQCKQTHTVSRVSALLSTRVSTEVKKDLEEFMRAEKLEQSSAVRKLLRTGLEEWKKRRSLELLERGEVTFNKAAELAGMDVWSFADLVRKSGITWISSVEKVKADIDGVAER